MLGRLSKVLTHWRGLKYPIKSECRPNPGDRRELYYRLAREDRMQGEGNGKQRKGDRNHQGGCAPSQAREIEEQKSTARLQSNAASERASRTFREFARMVFGSMAKAMGNYFKKRDGTRVQVVGIVGDGKYSSVTEAPQPAMFVPVLQSPSSQTYLVVRSSRDAGQLID